MTQHKNDSVARRLRLALTAANDFIPDGTPLPMPRGARSRRTVQPRMLAVSVAAAVAAVVVVPLLVKQQTDGSPTPVSSSAPPPYFRSHGEGGPVAVYSSQTGNRIDNVPLGGGPVGAMAAAPDRRTFYLEQRLDGCGSRLVRVALDSTGHVEQVEPVGAGEFPGRSADYLTVSPDGDRLVLVASRATKNRDMPGCSIQVDTGEVVVFDLSTGHQTVWTSSSRITVSPACQGYHMTSGVTAGLLAWLPDGKAVLVPLQRGDKVLGLVRVDLATGEVSVYDDRLAGKGLVGATLDASGEHALVFTAQRVGRYAEGEIRWYPNLRPWEVAW